ncbi:MAG TPA: response regulator [Opitutus sp.]|nr:response regulator [Opitutus sp.]
MATFSHAGNRLLADLLSGVQPLTIRADDSAAATADLFEEHALAEAVILSPAGSFVGVVTAESVLAWTVRELRRVNAGLANAATQPRPLLAAVPAAPDASAPFHVLVVEDHESSRQALTRVLESRGTQVCAVGSVAEALKASQNQRFALVISDIGLPDGDGYELMRMLQAQHMLPCVALTGFDRFAAMRASSGVNLFAHLSKPVDTSTLDSLLLSLRGSLPVQAS